jgi:hypothetical protein
MGILPRIEILRRREEGETVHESDFLIPLIDTIEQFFGFLSSRTLGLFLLTR